MSLSFSIFIAALAIMLTSLAGIIFLNSFLGKWMNKNMAFLVSFSAGVFLVTSVFLAREAFELSQAAIATGSIVGGFLLFLLGQKFLPESHHHHADECADGQCRSEVGRGSAIRMLAGDAIHNIGDGIILVAAFSVDIRLGIVAAVSVFIHEFLQEISEFFVLCRGGFSTGKALLYNFFVSATILIGVGLGFLLSSSEMTQGILIGVATGGFLFIVFHDLIPYHTLRNRENGTFWKHLLSFILGIAVLALANASVPHTHSHDDEHGYDHEGHHADEAHDEHDEGESEHGHHGDEAHEDGHEGDDHGHGH